MMPRNNENDSMNENSTNTSNQETIGTSKLETYNTSNLDSKKSVDLEIKMKEFKIESDRGISDSEAKSECENEKRTEVETKSVEIQNLEELD